MKHLIQSYLLTLIFFTFLPTVVLAQGDVTLDPIYNLNAVNHYDIVDSAADLSSAEKLMLKNNHFVVTDEKAWERFVDAYAWIFWKDLPVLITTDSMLHAVHQSYADLLIDLEQNVMRPELTTFLDATIEAHATNLPTIDDPVLMQAHADVSTYLEVARALLSVEDEIDPWDDTHLGMITDNVPLLSADAQEWFDAVMAADAWKTSHLFGPVLDMDGVDITRDVDMTMFTPRGHYPQNGLSGYFLAMVWMGQLDFRFSHTDFDSDTQSFVTTVQPNHIAASMMLRSAIDMAEQRDRWNMINDVLKLLAGESDNTTLNDLDQFIVDAGLSVPADALTADPAALLTLFEGNDYGTQRITGQIIEYDYALNASETPTQTQTVLPLSFMLFGTRFAIDSWVTSEVVFDRLKDPAGESLFRALPDPNDVAYVMGNDRALVHLQNDPDALGGFDYMAELTTMRTKVDNLPETWWDEPVYNGWLNLIRSLNEPAADSRVPSVMQTEPWADKNLQTQLASWAQLRHDNLLYTKQSFTIGFATCHFPDWYIEPQIGFYEELVNYAQAGLTLTAKLEAAGLSEPQLQSVYRADTYFASVEGVATILIDMIERQLSNEPFTYEDEMFIQNLIQKHTYTGVQGYGSGGLNVADFERWDGWYTTLFYDEDDTAAVIADIHTNVTSDPNSPLYPPRVAHVATGDVSPIYFIADKGNGPTLYVGPAFSYYEVTTVGDESTPAERLTDQLWQGQKNPDYEYVIYPTNKPNPPEWTQSFRTSSDYWGYRLEVDPGEVYTLRAKVRSTIWEFLFGDVEVIPGTINPPTEPSGVRVEAAVTVHNSNELPWAYPDQNSSYMRFNLGVNRYEVEFTNEGAVDRPQFTAQFFVDLNELYASSTPVDDVFVNLVEMDACKGSVSGLKAWNEYENLYSVTIDLRRHGLAAGESCRVAFEIVAFYPSIDGVGHAVQYGLAAGNYFENVLPTAPNNPLTIDNDFSAQGLMATMSETEFIPIFDDGVMIGGTLPPVQPIMSTLVGLGTAIAKSPIAQVKLTVIFTTMMVLLMSTVVMVRKRGRSAN